MGRTAHARSAYVHPTVPRTNRKKIAIFPSPEPQLPNRAIEPAPAGAHKHQAKVIPFPAPSPIPEEETRLLEAARHGDAEAFTLLAKQYDRKIFRLALRITGNQEDASDALQEAFMKAYANLKTFHGDSRFYTWLARIAVNEALTKLRKRLAHKQVSLDDDNVVIQEIADFCDNPEQRYAKTETREIIQEAIHTLTPALRTVLLLQYLEDFTSEQIAQRLGLSVPAVKSRLMRARLKLRHKLGRHFRRLEVVPDEALEAA